MINKPADLLTRKSSLALVIACLAYNPPVDSQTLQAKQVLQDPQFRAVLQRLTKKYKQEELNAAKEINPELNAAATPDTSGLVVENKLGTSGQYSDAFSSPVSVISNSSTELSTESRFTEGEELIFGLELETKNSPVAIADVFAIKSSSAVKIGFVTFVQLLELPIEVSSNFQQANGWLFNENNKFVWRIDTSGSLQVTVNAKTWSLPQDTFRIESDDIYIDIESLAEWFGFEFQIDESRLKLTLKTEKQFPVQLKLERRNKQIRSQTYSASSVMPYRETGYKIFSPPLFDAQVSTSKRGEETNLSYSLVGAQDLAYLTTNYYLSGSDDKKLSSARVTFGRESDRDDLLGPLKATQFEFGDILSVGNFRKSGNTLGAGLRFSNTPLVSSLDGQTVNLTGDMIDGWDVELYQNGILIQQKFSVSDGRYDFTDIQLEYGDNIFEIVFYGPQGQVETKTERFVLDGNSVKKGQFNYQFSTVKTNKSLFGIENDSVGDESSGIQTSLDMGYGLSQWLSLSSSIGQFEPNIGSDSTSYDIGMNADLFGVALFSGSVGEVKDDSRFSDFALRTRVKDTALSFNYSKSKDFALFNSNNRSNTTLSFAMSGRLFDGTALPVSYQNSWNKNENITRTSESYRNALSINSSIGSFSNSLELNEITENDRFENNLINQDLFFDESQIQNIIESLQSGEIEQQLLSKSINGGMQYSKNVSSFFTRLFANYTLKPESEFNSYGASLSYAINPDISSNLSVFKYVKTGQVAANIGVNWRFNSVYLSTSTSYNNNSGWSGGISARFGFGYGNDSRYFASNRGVSQAGVVTARVFEDKNLNGTFDSNEKVLSNAEVKAVQGGGLAVETNDKGLAVLTGLTPLVKTDIVVERNSFEDPSMKTLIPGVAITGRRGYLEHVDFAVTATGELEGTLYLSSDNGEMEPASYAGIHLIGSNGEIIDTTQTEFDGYYLFIDLVPGNYKVMIDKSFTKRRNLRLSDPVYLAVRGGQVINGADMFLNKREDASGYTAEMGNFSSLTVLKAYWSLLVKSGMNVAKLKPFYLYNEDSGKYLLSAGFYKEQHKASEICNRIVGRKITCIVKELDAKL